LTETSDEGVEWDGEAAWGAALALVSTCLRTASESVWVLGLTHECIVQRSQLER
jgi:hypothetical protein